MRRIALAGLVAFSSVCVVVACSSSSDDGGADSGDGGSSNDAVSDVSTSDASTSDASTTTDGAIATKTPIAGLVDMQNISWHNSEGGEPTFTMANVDMFPGVLGGIVINATWDEIQPTQSGALDFSVIDDALTQIRTYNAANASAPLGVKLRVYAGSNAPDWAKTLDGAAVQIYRNPAGCNGDAGVCSLTIGRYWMADYISAWRSFQAQLAARYDAEPLVREVAVTSCAQQTDEPFVPSTDATSKGNLMTAGLSDAEQEACLQSAFADYAAWNATLVDYTFNPFAPLAGGADSAFTVGVMKACRAALGSRCVLDNHILDWPLNAPNVPIYDEMETLGAPISFQTGSPVQMDCTWTQTIAQGVSIGAGAIEVWPDAKFHGIDSFTLPEVTTLASEFVTPIPVLDAGLLDSADAGGCPGFH